MVLPGALSRSQSLDSAVAGLPGPGSMTAAAAAASSSRHANAAASGANSSQPSESEAAPGGLHRYLSDISSLLRKPPLASRGPPAVGHGRQEIPSYPRWPSSEPPCTRKATASRVATAEAACLGRAARQQEAVSAGRHPPPHPPPLRSSIRPLPSPPPPSSCCSTWTAATTAASISRRVPRLVASDVLHLVLLHFTSHLVLLHFTSLHTWCYFTSHLRIDPSRVK